MTLRRTLLSFGLSLLTAVAPFSAGAQAAAAKAPAADPLITNADRNRILGKEGAPLWLLIVSDFQCPYCRQWHKETWDAVRTEFVVTGKVRVAYVNFPLGIHPNAKPAARYAMCASGQKKFWEFADQLFNTQDQWKDLKDPSVFFVGLADKVRLSPLELQGCVSSGAIAALVDGDYARMARAGARSTPTFFIGKTMIEGAAPIADFRKAIAAELAAAKKP